MTDIGRVVALTRYPVKSMRGESLDEVDVSWHGLRGDRRWALLRLGSERDDFPWLTIREVPTMVTYQARLVGRQRPNSSDVVVETPDGRTIDVADPGLADELCPGSRVIRLARGAPDAMPVSLLTTRSVDAVSDLAGVVPDPRRFRPSILVEPTGQGDVPEEAWLGHEIAVGEVRLRVDRLTVRCPIITVDPDTAERDPALLEAVARHHDNRLGVYASTVTPGTVRTGDPVRILS